ncbi:hypothetical protein ACH50O_09105 [Methylomonas sp. 2BW1-5-20]|uniref:hypothetical protein n=1 Tax=Methylomonas sp. 2BW1-5-20 TaxID=3376686 RepID=UPI00404C2A96
MRLDQFAVTGGVVLQQNIRAVAYSIAIAASSQTEHRYQLAGQRVINDGKPRLCWGTPKGLTYEAVNRILGNLINSLENPK